MLCPGRFILVESVQEVVKEKDTKGVHFEFVSGPGAVLVWSVPIFLCPFQSSLLHPLSQGLLNI